MLFHRTESAVTVYSQVEEENLGPGWSRTILAQDPDRPDDDEDDEKQPEKQSDPVPVPAEPKRAIKRYANR